MSGTQDIEAEIARTRAELKAAVDDVKIAVADLTRRVTGDVRPLGEPEPTRKGWIVLGVGVALAAAVVTKVVRKF